MEGLWQGCFLHGNKFRFSDPEKSLDHNHCVMFFGKTQSSCRTLSTLELTCVPGNLLGNLTEYWGLTHPPWTSMQSGRVKAELYLLLLPCQAARPPYNPTGYSAEPNAQSYFIHRYMFFPSVWHMYLRSTVYYFGFSCNRYPYPRHPAF